MDIRKVYGIEIDESLPRGGEKRIMDAEGMENDYTVNGIFQKNGGKNDFDEAYPFGAMRLCNVRVEDGRIQVIYEGEPGFTRSGESGNVMVQVPKFYSCRKKQGTVEQWMVSGTCHRGFALEPCFLRGGKELEYVYVGVYNAANCGNGVFSSTDTFPDVNKTLDAFREEFAQWQMDCYDFAIHMALQKLLVIEFGRRDVKSALGGIGRMKYFSRIRPTNAIEAVRPNCVSVLNQGRNLFFAIGHQIGFGHTEKDLTMHRTVSRVQINPDNPQWVDVYYDGEDLSSKIAPKEDAIYGIPQRNGLADPMLYHTGRWELHAPLAPEEDARISPFCYRHIENVWGNVWEFTAGLRMYKLDYYYTFDPEQYSQPIESWQKFPFPAKEMNELPDHVPDRPHWVSGMGFDENASAVLLPTQFSYGRMGDYYDGLIYSFLDKDFMNKPVDPEWIYNTVTGGGFDHMYMSLFAYRCFMLPGAKSWLYSNRVCLRR